MKRPSDEFQSFLSCIVLNTTKNTIAFRTCTHSSKPVKSKNCYHMPMVIDPQDVGFKRLRKGDYFIFWMGANGGYSSVAMKVASSHDYSEDQFIEVVEATNDNFWKKFLVKKAGEMIGGTDAPT